MRVPKKTTEISVRPRCRDYLFYKNNLGISCRELQQLRRSMLEAFGASPFVTSLNMEFLRTEVPTISLENIFNQNYFTRLLHQQLMAIFYYNKRIVKKSSCKTTKTCWTFECIGGNIFSEELRYYSNQSTFVDVFSKL